MRTDYDKYVQLKNDLVSLSGEMVHAGDENTMQALNKDYMERAGRIQQFENSFNGVGKMLEHLESESRI